MPTLRDAVLLDNPRFYATFEESASPSRSIVGNYSGTDTGAVERWPAYSASGWAGAVGGAYFPSGTRISFGAVSDLWPVGHQDFSIMAVIRPDTIDATFRRAFSFENSTSTEGWMLGVVFESSQNRFRFQRGVAGAAPNTQVYSSTLAPVTGTTYMMHLVYSGETMFCYVDGVLLTSIISRQAAVAYATGSMVVGDRTAADRPFNGFVNEAAYFPHALTAERVAAHYAERNNNTYAADVTYAQSDFVQTNTFQFAAGGTTTPVSGTDAASVTEGATVVQITATVTDSVVVGEARTLTVDLARTESGTLTDTAAKSEQLAVAGSETFAATEAAALANALAASETHTTSELAALANTLAATESHVVSEALALSATLAASESQGFADAAAKTETLALSASDLFSLVETALLAEQADKTASDSLTLSEAVSLANTLGASESHATAESISLTSSLSAADALTLTEAVVAQANLSVAEAVTFAEAVALASSLSIVDALALAEAAAAQAELSRSDSSSLDEAAGAQAEFSLADAITLGESASLGGETQKIASDSAGLFETLELAAQVDAVDTAVETSLEALAADLSAFDALMLGETAGVLETLYKEASETFTLSEIASTATALEAFDAAFLDEVGIIDVVEAKSAFDELLLAAETAVLDPFGITAPDVDLPTNAALRSWASAVVLAAYSSQASVAAHAAGVDLAARMKDVNVEARTHSSDVKPAKAEVTVG